MFKIVTATLLLISPSLSSARPPPPDLSQVPFPTFYDVDHYDVFQRLLKGTWAAHAGVPQLKFEISGRKPNHYRLRVLTHRYCHWLLTGDYGLTTDKEQPPSAPELRIFKAEFSFDGDRKKTNCLGMRAWITFDFASPPNYEVAKVTVREQFEQGPVENEYEMTHKR